MTTHLSVRIVLAIVCSLLTVSTAPASGAIAQVAAADTAAMHRGNPERTGEFAGPAPHATPTARWYAWLGLLISATPVVADGTVYVGTVTPLSLEGGALHAVDVETGEQRWRWSSNDGDGIFASAAVVDDRVYIGTYDGIVAALATDDGTELWRFKAESNVFSSPAVVGGVVYVGDFAGYVYALSAEDGRELWRFSIDLPYDRAVSGSLAVNDGTVYASLTARRLTLDSLLVALDADSGKERWRFLAPEGGGVRGTPVSAEGAIFVQTDEGSVYRLNAETGNARWQFVMPSAFSFSGLAYGDGVIYAVDVSGLLVAIDAEKGEDRWGVQVTEGVPLTASPALVDGLILICDADGVLFAFDVATHEALWAVIVDSFMSSPFVAEGTVYIGSDDGFLFALA